MCTIICTLKCKYTQKEREGEREEREKQCSGEESWGLLLFCHLWDIRTKFMWSSLKVAPKLGKLPHQSKILLLNFIYFTIS